MSPLNSQYKIDNTLIDKYAVQSIISQSQNANKVTTLSQAFNLCDKLVEYDENPNDRTVKIEIKNLIEQKLTNKQLQSSQTQALKKYRTNLSQVYMLNKPGNFGRVLERKCRIVQKGVMEYEEGKEAKLKEVKSFMNKIQHVQNKQLADLAWISTEPQKYKFRIILYDMNQNSKGIYFETYEQAQSVRSYLIFRYKKTSINNQIFSSLKYRLLQGTINGLVEKIKYRAIITKINQEKKPKIQPQRQNIESSNRSQIKFSKVGEIKKSVNSLNDEKQEEKNQQNQQSEARLSKKQQNQEKKSYMTGFLDDLINQHNKNNGLGFSNRQSQKSINLNDKSNNQRSKIPNQKINNSYQNQQSDISKSRITNGRDGNAQRKLQNSRLQQQKPSSVMSPFNKFQDYEESEQNPFALPITINGQNVSSAQSSPIKQSSRINKVLGHSRKQQSIFKLPGKIQEEQNLSETQQYAKLTKKVGTQKIVFKSVEFMDHNLLFGKEQNDQNVDETNKEQKKKKNDNKLLLFKPIITISIHKHKKKDDLLARQKPKNTRSRIQEENFIQRQQQQSKKGELIFNTIIKKANRTMEYELVPTQGDSTFETEQAMNSMYLVLSVTNFLTNEEVFQCMFEFKQFGFVRYKNIIIDTESKMRIKFDYQNTGVAEPQAVYNNNQNSQASLFFAIPKIDPEIIKKIKTFWQSEAISNSYYSLEDNFNIFDAVSNSSNQAQPLNWWLDLDEKEYNYLCILKSSSQIVGYKLCQPMLYIIKAVKNIHFKIQKIIEMLLSMILNLGNYYYFPQNLNKVNYLHRQVGLSKGNIDFENRIFLQVLLFDKLLAFQCPQLNEKLQRKNIVISHLMLEYTYELFSRNFSIEVLCEYWSYCAEEIQKVPLIFFLTTISLCRLLSDKLMTCNRLLDIRQVFESKKIRSSIYLLNEIKILRAKYFSKGEGFIQEIKSAFQQKPFENVLNIYYKRLNDNQARSKRDNTKYKQELCAKVLQHVEPEEALDLFTKYVREPKKYTFHVYFYTLPQKQGKFMICNGNNKYESLNIYKNRYFILGDVTQKIIIRFIDFEGNIFYGQLIMNQGFNQFKIKLVSDKTEEEIQLHYLCGLLTDMQIEMIKANKKFSHFIGPNIPLDLFKDEFLRPLKQTRHNQTWMTEEWFRDLRILFSHGNKLFSEVGYFMNLLIAENITHQQKLSKIKQFSIKISQQYFLSDNLIVYKQLLFEFYKMSFIPLKEQDFQCYFNDSLELEFQAPKILKCRYVTQTKEIKLQKQLNEYWSKKCFSYLYGDLFLDQILTVVEKHIRSKVPTSQTQGELKILYSTFGNVELKVISMKIQNKRLTIDYEKKEISESVFHEVAQKQPELLMTEILPSFTKISTILDFVNSSKNIDLKARSRQNMQKKVIPQTINLLKYAQNKMKNCILLRYNSYPTMVNVPFYAYYSELIMNPDIPKFKYYYFNNVKDSIKSVCISKEQLKCSSNNKQLSKDFDKTIGLHGNLRKLLKLSNQANTAFFWTQTKQEQSIPKSLIWMNYGYGVGRWESCIIRQYRKMLKIRNKNSRTPKNQNYPKKKQHNNKFEYLVEKGGNKFYTRDYQVKVNPQAKESLTQTRNQLEDEFLQANTEIKKSLGFLLSPENLSAFVKSVNR